MGIRSGSSWDILLGLVYNMRYRTARAALTTKPGPGNSRPHHRSFCDEESGGRSAGGSCDRVL